MTAKMCFFIIIIVTVCILNVYRSTFSHGLEFKNRNTAISNRNTCRI